MRVRAPFPVHLEIRRPGIAPYALTYYVALTAAHVASLQSSALLPDAWPEHRPYSNATAGDSRSLRRATLDAIAEYQSTLEDGLQGDSDHA